MTTGIHPQAVRLPGATCPQISTVQILLKRILAGLPERMQAELADDITRATAELDSLREAHATLRAAAEPAAAKLAYRQDLYDQLADALGCDDMDSHAGRCDRARRLRALEKTS